ncbi:MAG: CDP-alcohol phosphatidyltransferase family protein [Oscillospiraceae bacterium]|nr:CDP-alcohol phosphatidyltransferase family protein [Oscillospiraceae bacterium]
MIIKDWKKEIFTIPNLLSLFRLVLIPLYVAIYLNARNNADYYLAAAILAVSCLTDLIDGQIARRCNMISTVGKVLDPFADKITQFTLVICLSIKYPILWTLIILIFVKEIFQLTAGIICFKKGRMLKGAQITGKICTTVLFVSLIILVMMPDISYTIVEWITVIDAIFLLIAFADYIIVYIRKDAKFQVLEDKKED